MPTIRSIPAAIRGQAAAAFAVVLAAALAPPAAAQPTLADPNRAAVVNADAVRRFFHLAETRRVDIALIGDSNVRNALISGHEDGMSRAFSARFGCYATRIDPVAGQGGWAATITDLASYQVGPFRGTGAPPIAAQYAFSSQAFPVGYAFLPHLTSTNFDYNAGFTIATGHPIGIDGDVRYHFTQYRFRTPTSGVLNFSIRQPFPASPEFNFVAAPAIRTAAAAPGLSDEVVEIPAAERPTGAMLCCPADFAGVRASTGPIFLLWNRLERVDRAAGIAVSPLLYQGGRSARSACEELTALGPAAPALQEWLRQAIRLQAPAAPVLMVHILHGGNDAGDYGVSCGPSTEVLYSNTAAGHADNLRGIMRHLRDAWAVAGYPADNLFFMLGPYHPRGDRLSDQLGYEAQWVALAAESPSTIAVRGTMMTTPEEFDALGYHASAIDKAHLSVAGYRAWGAATVEVLQRAACPADVNHDRTTTVDDVFAFIGDWFALDPHADFNLDTLVSVDDLFAFLAEWFRGC